MQQRHGQTSESNLEDLLCTYLHVSARYAPPSYSLRSVATAYNAWPVQTPKAEPTSQTADTLQPCSDGGANAGLTHLQLPHTGRTRLSPAHPLILNHAERSFE